MAKEVIVVGGGTAGWITALYTQKVHPNCQITLIESEDIGILGAGEGSVPLFKELMDFLGISTEEAIVEADATIKLGIKFINWHGGGANDFFYHSFYPFTNRDIFCGLISTTNLSIAKELYENGHFFNIDLYTQLGELNKCPFTDFNPESTRVAGSGGKGRAPYSWHFDARKLAKLLKKKGVERGIKLVDDIVTDAEQDEDGDITKIITQNNSYKCDFVFDCTGFKRLLIGEKYNTKWKSYKDFLPVDTAIPFFTPLPPNGEIPPRTDAVAMKHGWMWIIPTCERFGCGYVFDSSTCSEEQAKEEINQVFGKEIETNKAIKFEAGRLEEMRTNNCAAIGLSSSFVEPLEATSLMVSAISLFTSVPYIFMPKGEKREASIKTTNRLYGDVNDRVLDFIMFHYISARKDTEFWKKFSKDKVSDYLKNIYNIFETSLLSALEFATLDNSNTVFGYANYLAVGIGNKTINKDNIKDYYESISTTVDQSKDEIHNEMLNAISHSVEQSMPHSLYLNTLRKEEPSPQNRQIQYGVGSTRVI
jgi:tryptophan halogenase